MYFQNIIWPNIFWLSFQNIFKTNIFFTLFQPNSFKTFFKLNFFSAFFPNIYQSKKCLNFFSMPCVKKLCKKTCLKSALSCLDPQDWSCVHVQKWLLWTEHLYRLPQVSAMFQQVSGRDLCSMSESDFRQRSSQFGDMMYAHLDIWRSGENTLNTGGNQPTQSLLKGWSWSQCSVTKTIFRTWL